MNWTEHRLLVGSFLSYPFPLSAGRGDRVPSGAFEPLSELGPWVGFAFLGATSPLESLCRRPTHPPPTFSPYSSSVGGRYACHKKAFSSPPAEGRSSQRCRHRRRQRGTRRCCAYGSRGDARAHLRRLHRRPTHARRLADTLPYHHRRP